MGLVCLVRPWAAARPRAVRAASFARRVGSKPGQAPPPPTSAAAWPSGPSGPLRSGSVWSASISHVIPLGLLQDLNCVLWYFNVLGCLEK